MVVRNPEFPQEELESRTQENKVTVLVIDDYAGVRAFLRELVVRVFPGLRISGAEDGEEAAASACSNSSNLLLMDLGPQRKNVIEASQNIKASIPRAHVVIVTDNDTDQYQHEAAVAGASAYVIKATMNTEVIPLLKGLLMHV